MRSTKPLPTARQAAPSSSRTQQAYLEEEWSLALAARPDAWLLLVDTPAPQHHRTTALLPRAFRADDAAERLALCVEALGAGRTAPALVATASVCMEVNDLEAAARDLEEAVVARPAVGRRPLRARQAVADAATT